jgi:hypothetical protein
MGEAQIYRGKDGGGAGLGRKGWEISSTKHNFRKAGRNIHRQKIKLICYPLC